MSKRITCVFCQKTVPRAKEHIFATWLQESLEITGTELAIHQIDIRTGKIQKSSNSFPYQGHVYGKVCSECNGGWMSKLEKTVKQILPDLIHDSQKLTAISRVDADMLARWIYKTALMLNAASFVEHYKGVIPATHFQAIFEGRFPPNSRVSIARSVTKYLLPTWIQSAGWIGPPEIVRNEVFIKQIKQTYRITIGIGHFAARVYHFPLTYKLFDLDQNSIHHIHPPTRHETYAWPSHESMSDLAEFNTSLQIGQELRDNPFPIDQYYED